MLSCWPLAAVAAYSNGNREKPGKNCRLPSPQRSSKAIPPATPTNTGLKLPRQPPDNDEISRTAPTSRIRAESHAAPAAPCDRARPEDRKRAGNERIERRSTRYGFGFDVLLHLVQPRTRRVARQRAIRFGRLRTVKTLEIAILALVGIVVVLHLLKSGLRRSACRAGAESIYRDLSVLFQGEHTHRHAKRADFPDFDDWSRYDLVRQQLESRGFRSLGGFEDVTVSDLHPENRTLIESYVDADGTTCASTYEIQGHHICDFVTECEDGRFLLTTNANLDKLTPPPTVDRATFPEETSVTVMHAKHGERVSAGRSRGTRFNSVKTMDDLMDGARRYSRISAEFRQSLGLLTESELLSLTTDPGQKPAARIVWKEFRKLYESEQGQRAA